MSARVENELVRVRRELGELDGQIQRVQKELDVAQELSDRDAVSDLRNVRQCLWKDKDQLRTQETICLRVILSEASPAAPAPMTPMVAENKDSLGDIKIVFQETHQGDSKSPGDQIVRGSAACEDEVQRLLSKKRFRSKGFSPMAPKALELTPSNKVNGADGSVDPAVSAITSGGQTSTPCVNPHGYEVNRSADCKVIDVWREWKEGIHGHPSIEAMEEARKKDRKNVWWKTMNDYKYWGKQMRVIHAVEQKALELGSIEASIDFWESILKVEFDGSVSKLREALGGQKTNDEDTSNFKRRCKELLRRALLRKKTEEEQQHQLGASIRPLGLVVQPQQQLDKLVQLVALPAAPPINPQSQLQQEQTRGALLPGVMGGLGMMALAEGVEVEDEVDGSAVGAAGANEEPQGAPMAPLMDESVALPVSDVVEPKYEGGSVVTQQQQLQQEQVAVSGVMGVVSGLVPAHGMILSGGPPTQAGQ